jgi:hypothetical protein
MENSENSVIISEAHAGDGIVRFQVLTAAGVEMTVFWGVASCSLI